MAILTYAFAEARHDPVVRTARIALPGWPAGAAPVRMVLISDIHIGTAAMDAARLDRIVMQIDALRPDLVLIAGDFIFGHDPRGAERLGPAMVAPLSRLRARLGVVAVMGNHDNWTGAATVRAQLASAGIIVLENQAIVRGPLALGGVGDDFSGHADLPATLAALRRLPGARVLLTHSPDLAPMLPDDTTLLLAGHTHCGQVVLPLFGPLSEVSRYGNRFRCGLIVEGSHIIVVTGGLGASGVSLRLGAPPDLWLLTLGPKVSAP
ncbi:metallophosphoesterase [uncultured Sphingomonas sp.]|uniref:metallophosphoesterase n=1 Tax=uncultured Sphingomonas sp. TaxID=158754 RepID=UPI0035C95D88